MLNDTLILAPVVPISLEEVLTELEHFLANPAKTLGDFVSTVALNGGVSFFRQPIQAVPIFRTHETSGFNYTFDRKMVAYVRFGVTTSGYFVVQSMIVRPQSAWVSHYYSADGRYAFSEGPLTHQFAENSSLLIEPNCPVLNHLYNILADGYAETHVGKSNTSRIYTIEKLFRRFEKTRRAELSFSKGAKDPAILEINDRMLKLEMDPVYTWKERHHLFKLLKEERSKIIRVKRRAHRKSRFRYSFPIWIVDGKAAAQRFALRPASNLLGLLDRLCLDPLRWFVDNVRGNLGYSIALAIYSPFMFFFITQPLNPQAMWAVGKVRSAYLETTDTVQHLFGHDSKQTASSALASTAVTAAGVGKITPTLTDTLRKEQAPIQLGRFGLPLTAEDPALNNQSWDERMSNFKAMEIAYEGNMEIAPRFGRLEQMETQLNWPLIIESTWLETERYLNFVNFILSDAKDYAPQFVTYMQNEKERANHVELYLWDRNVRFILDHPYTLMDQSHEQTQYDYYVGRAFINLRSMTKTLSQRFKGLPIPAGFENIDKLATRFERDYKKDGGVLERLKNNSKLFAQQDKTDTQELRSYMQRQWEILYLLQNKAQEGSNNGLQLYVWSVRNNVWLLQSLYSSKREETSILSLAFKKGAPVNKLTNNLEFKQIDAQYEALFHMMVLEYTSVRKEIGGSLKGDLESTQRKTIIDGVESFLKERDQLLKGANLL